MKVTVFEILFSIAVSASFAIGQTKMACPAVCSLCSPEHIRLNGTVFNMTTALCKWKSGDKLTDIPPTLPTNLGKLVMTSHNVQTLRSSSLTKFRLLHHLYLDKNNLQWIEDGAFYQQRYLTELDLKDNEVANISKEAFHGLISLQVLRLDHNKITRILRGTFEYSPSIKYVDLQRNRIQVLEEGAFDRLDHLETLLLNYNSLITIERGNFGNLMSLKRLELGFNQIRKIDRKTFSCAPLINKLAIKNNRLDAIPKEAIQNLGFLESLEMDGNPIKFVESGAFNGLRNLKTLDVSNCSISSIQSGAFDGLTMIETVDLQQNPLNCDCHMSWLRRWLSGKQDDMLIGSICRSPSDISGQKLIVANLSSFVCSCDTCKKDASCAQAQSNCSCSKNWAGPSCDDACQSTRRGCRRFGGKCFCQNESVSQLQNQNAVNCSFNMTSKRCSENGKINKFGSHLECVCSEGFVGDGVNCSDKNECETGGTHCHAQHADCINTPGSYRCTCHPGYKDVYPGLPPGMLCDDIDECNQLQKACHVNAACKNIPGSHICSCLPGYSGDGKTCFPVPEKPTELTVTTTSTNEASVTWSVGNTSIISRFTVEYKGLGISGPEWEHVIITNPRDTHTVNLTDLVPDSTYVVRIGVFSIFNTSVYSDEQMFATAATPPVPTSNHVTGDASQKAVVLAVGLVVAIVVLVVIAIGLHVLLRKKNKRNRNTNPQYVPGLEDLIEMRTHSHSGTTDARLTRDFLEHGSTVSYPGDFTDDWEVPRDQLVIGQKIGEGQFGLVLEGTLMTEDGPMKVAVKTMKEHADRFDYKDLLQEMEMMKEVGQHPHVVSLLGMCTTAGPLYIIIEYVSGGNLLDYLRSSRPSDETYVNIISTLSSRDLVKIALDVARGMNHIAMKKFVHRDLAARNILLTEDYEAKVADFGLARDIYGDGQYVKTGGGRVPIKWMAPESIQDQLYTTKSDVWAFGVLLWEIVTIGAAPYPCVPVNLLLSKLQCGYRMSKPAHCSDELHDLMMTCWQLDPEVRPTFSEICESLSEMLSESARSYVNITVSDERVWPENDIEDDEQEQTTSV